MQVRDVDGFMKQSRFRKNANKNAFTALSYDLKKCHIIAEVTTSSICAF